ncbi:unnamed protein product [Linum tenue]|uniref:Apyrase n=1 Tax=Linum tenue TaxID=586396 RepID=A0AAV0ILT1_9ROSI|nr:unnamed protein product [Linum tenue]
MEVEPISPSKFKLSIWSPARVLRICTIASLVLLLLVGVYYALQHGEVHFHGESGHHHTVVLDCGSTGTRVSVYKWEANRSKDSGLPVLVNSYPEFEHSARSSTLKRTFACKYHCFQTKPGLDSFLGNSSGVKLALEPLIRLAERWVPRERHEETPIFVLATAGLRRLEGEDARRVLDDVVGVVKEHSFVYRKNWVRVLSGKEEAYYGWVALNYRMGRLGNSSMGPALGLLDLGGSSLQVVTEVDGTDAHRANEHLMSSKVRSVEHWILAYSLPSFGLNGAFDRTINLLPVDRTTGDAVKIKHPCLSSEFEKTNASHQMTKTEHYHIVGDPNWKRCKAVARAAAMNTSSFDWPTSMMVGSNCKARFSFNDSSNIPNLASGSHKTRHFHALSGFFAVHNILKLEARANFTKIWETAGKLCSSQQLSTELSSKFGNKKYGSQYCFSLPYMVSLIQDLLCLRDEQITFGPGDLSWTLGAALVEGEDYHHGQQSSTTTREGKEDIGFSRSMDYYIHSPVFVFLLLLLLLIVVYYSQIKLPMLGRKKAAATLSRGPSLPSYIYPKQRPN